jgi:hypothetical protein
MLSESSRDKEYGGEEDSVLLRSHFGGGGCILIGMYDLERLF